MAYPITEDLAACGWRINQDAMTATKQVKLIYTNRMSQRVEVTACQASETLPAFELTENTEACELRHDFAAAISHQRARFDWTYNDQLETTGFCEDTGVTYPHYQELSGCSWEYNLDTNEAYATGRTAVLIDDKPFLIDQVCVPDPTTTVSLQGTNDGCANSLFDDYANQVTYGSQRFFYIRTDGQRVYVTACAQDETIQYPHQLRTASYLHNDLQRQSTPLQEIYITTPTGENIRSPAQQRAGVVPVAYQYLGANIVMDQVTYEGCSKTTTTLNVEQYERADATIYNHPNGPDTPIGPVNSCTQIVQTPRWEDQNKEYLRSCYGYTEVRPNGDFYITTCVSTIRGNYRGTRQLSRDDGATITQTSSAIHQESWTASKSAAFANPGYPPYPEGSYQATYTGPNMTSWNQAEGW